MLTTTGYYKFGGQCIAVRQIVGTNQTLSYLHGDHPSTAFRAGFGSASLTTDWQGNRVGELRYKPYGETCSAWGATPMDRRFTGQRSEEAGLGSLYDYNARF